MSIEKGCLGFAEGMMVGRHRTSDYGFRQVDWIKVKEFIETNKDELASIDVGLAEDWNYTSGEVWNSKDGYIPKEDTYVYACSKWATPSMDITYKNGDSEMIECWILGDDSDSYFEF